LIPSAGVFIPLVIVAIIITLMIVVSLAGVFILVVGIPVARRVAIAIIIVALLVARHDAAIAIENLNRALIHQVSPCA
jgi:hypothetical protein